MSASDIEKGIIAKAKAFWQAHPRASYIIVGVFVVGTVAFWLGFHVAP